MCGIVAMFSRRGPVSIEALERGMRTLHHRGPDGSRHWIAPHARIALGHTRLSIIDLTGGDQPIASEDERIHVIVNGEFYDFERIRRELTARGHTLRTHSDSEIAIHLYEDYGARALEELRGEFAMVLWDEANGTLLAARDRFGVKPLYYAQVGDTLYLASEAKALFAAGVPARWDHESYFQVSHVYFDQDRSLFEGVRQVPPGCYLLATKHHIQVVRYWDFDYPKIGAAETQRSEQEHIEGLRAALDESVRIRLRADVPVGCYLSGGLDSCTLLGIAARHHPEPIEAFTLCFDVSEYNEQAVAEEMAALAGANFHPLPITQTQLADNFSDSVYHSETTVANPHGTAKYLLSEMVRDHGFKVVLTGEGSDEIFGGYAHFRRDMLLYNTHGQDPIEVERSLTDLTEANPVSRGVLLPSGEPLPMESVRRELGFVPSWMEVRSANSVRYRRLFRPEFMREFADRDPFRVYLNRFDVTGQLVGREPVHQSLYLWTRTMLPNFLLNVLGDRMEMAHSIEGRVPFLDHKVVELVRDMPVAMKIRGLTEKYALREAAKPFVSDTVYRRQKHPFLAPPSGLEQSGRLSQLTQDTLRSETLDHQPFFDPKAVRGLLDLMPSFDDQRRSGASYILTLVLSTCMLHERFSL